jgi:hypothetical protein
MDMENRNNTFTRSKNDPRMIPIFRFTFSEPFLQELYLFAKIHEFDERKYFKEAWNIWLKEKEDIVLLESEKLVQIGYQGDVLEKMFKSARYYFRKKNTEKKEAKKRREYTGLSKELIDAMDAHVMSNANLRPSTCFDEFCNNHVDLLKEEVKHLLNCSGFTNANDIREKIKKTYKNRSFMRTHEKKKTLDNI